jgi:hypothetical protein
LIYAPAVAEVVGVLKKPFVRDDLLAMLMEAFTWDRNVAEA